VKNIRKILAGLCAASCAVPICGNALCIQMGDFFQIYWTGVASIPEDCSCVRVCKMCLISVYSSGVTFPANRVYPSYILMRRSC
jgi:hypothetical protein